MKDKSTASVSAAAAALARGLAQYLPAPLDTLAPDDMSWRLAGFSVLPSLMATFPRAARLFVSFAPVVASWMTVRTRLIDDALVAFVERGGKQARQCVDKEDSKGDAFWSGFDSRAIRLATKLNGATVFEVDSPGSQLQKRAAVTCLFPSAVASKGDPSSQAGLRFVAQDFEHEPVDSLPDALRREGLDTNKPTFVLLEGVVEYLTPEAVDATVRIARALGGAHSRLVVEFVRPSDHRMSRAERFFARFDPSGEEIRFKGWDDGALGPYLAERGLKLLSSESTNEAAQRFKARPVTGVVTFVAVAEAT